jgi:valyl-tRNA synthetase
MDKRFDHKELEDKIYKNWENSGYFSPEKCIKEGVCKKNAEPFSIVLPPPNVTGTLHMGHAVMLAIEDIMVRFNRMRGKRTLWIPGTDHAAIATQEKVERTLYEKEKKTRHDLGREKFLKLVDKFAEESHNRIVYQMKKMGASLDWSREAFTLDKERSLAVNTAFGLMYDAGLIFRGDRIINWDPKMQTTVSDDEVEWEERKSHFYYLKYGPFTIGTARPETKFGDKYVVMHPDDKRYKKYKHGDKISVDWINGKIVATIIKDKAIDPKFGTGVMTITPWHDTTDFEIAERHDLDKEQIIGLDGDLLPIAEEFAGMSIKEARPKIVEKLKSRGLLEKIDENYTHRVAKSSRGGGMIEPQIMRQWFVDVNKKFKPPLWDGAKSKNQKETTLKELMKKAVTSGEIKILPERFEKVYFHWIDNLRDWCISRQLWYGHRVPVWYKKEEIYVGAEAPKGGDWKQDPDTLDTWFSSGLWTFSTLDWPNEKNDLEIYHPTSVLETGYDIIFFWVARMILMSTAILGEIPFKQVYLHGIVRDDKGKKMSKSLGNVIDPIDMIEKYGADATRLSLVIGTGPGNDINLNEDKVRSYRNFSTKVWNVGRFLIMTKPDNYNQRKGEKSISSDDKKRLKELEKAKKEITKHYEDFEFHLAGEKAYHYLWSTFANEILEERKERLKEGGEEDKFGAYYLLETIYKECLKMLHPFMPFVTEEIYQKLGNKNKELLMIEEW